MRNLACRKLSILRRSADSRVCKDCVKVADIRGNRVVFFVSCTSVEGGIEFWLEHTLVSNINSESLALIPWKKCSISSVLGSRCKDLVCTSLDLLNGGESIVIAMRSGEIIEVQSDSGEAEIVGEFVDDSPEYSGVLSVRTSPDGTVIAILSPVKVTIMSSSWDVIAEIPLGVAGVSASVSWRGDGEFFVVSVKGLSRIAHGYILTRAGELVSELDANTMQNEDRTLGDGVAWRPRVGGLICHAGPGYRLSFFERNGLRHLRSDFDLSPALENAGSMDTTRRILSMVWSTDSDKLAVACKVVNHYTVDVFTHTNYKWYRKKRVTCTEEPAALLWDEDDPNLFFIITVCHDIIVVQLHSVSGCIEIVSGTHAAVIEGRELLVTNLSKAIVPAPMCHDRLMFPDCIDAVCAFPASSGVGVLLCNGDFHRIVFSSDATLVQGAPAIWAAEGTTRNIWTLGSKSLSSCGVMLDRSPVLLTGEMLMTVRSHDCLGNTAVVGVDHLCLFRLVPGENEATLIGSFPASGTVVALSPMKHFGDRILMATDNGALCCVQVTFSKNCPLFSIESQTSPQSWYQPSAIELLSFKHSSSFALVRFKSGNLVVVELRTGAMFLISKECTSYAVSGKFLTFTTRSHVLYCLLMEDQDSRPECEENREFKSLFSFLNDAFQTKSDKNSKLEDLPMLPENFGATRPIDRGSVIVAPLKKDVRLILQAPRGNLETIAPRPIVEAKVRELALRKEYGKAFRLSRQQRVDMNILVDVDTDAFLANVPMFVRQVEKASHISIFLTYLKGTVEKTNSICDAIIEALKGATANLPLRDIDLVPALLTAYVRKSPSDYNNALLEIWDKHKENDNRTKGYIDFLFVLCKDDTALYGHALGTYDLSLAALVAKTSKELDPAEYTKELRQLQGMGDHERKFAIDLRLERYESALHHLHSHEAAEYASHASEDGEIIAASEFAFSRSVSLAVEKEIFPTALELFRGNRKISQVLRSTYGEHLMKLGRHADAAVAFCSVNEPEKAAHAYELTGNWELAVGTMAQSALDQSAKRAFYGSVADRLQERGMARDAAHVRTTLLGDIEGALDGLFVAELWADAIQTVCHAPNPALWTTLREAVREAGEGLNDDLNENAAKLCERGKRLRVVRETKRLFRERMTSHGGLDIDDDGSDAFSRTTGSSVGSNVSDLTFVGRSAATSVYTTASGSVSAAEKRKEKSAERRRNKARKKRVKEGHPQEEEFLVGYLRKMAPNEFLNSRVKSMVDALLFIGEIQLAERVAGAMTKLAEESLKLADDVIQSALSKEIANRRDWESEVLKVCSRSLVTP